MKGGEIPEFDEFFINEFAISRKMKFDDLFCYL